MAKPVYAQLTADLIKRTVATKQTRIIGPNGSIETFWAVIPEKAA